MTKVPQDPDTVTVRVPFRIVKRGGRKEMQLPADMPIRRQTDDAFVKALARVSLEAHAGQRCLVNNRRSSAARVNGADLPPGRPSFMTRVLGVDSGRLGVGQARRARSPQIAQAPGARRTGSFCPARNAA